MTIEITKEFLIEKYVEEKMNTIQIAKICNCSNTTISRYLKIYDITIRSKNSAKNPNARWDLLNSKEWMSKKYEDELLTTYQIAKECNCSVLPVGRQLKKFGIEIRSNSESQNPNARWDLLNNKEWMSEKYEDELLSVVKIAKECNCGSTLVWNQLKKFGIERRSNSEAKNPNVRWDLLNNKEWLSEKYEDDLLSTVKIAEECECSNNLVQKHLKKFGIEIRSNSEAKNPNARWELLNNKEWMSEKYEDELLTTSQIAEECECSNSLIGRQLKKFGIDTRSNSESQNPNARWNLLNNKVWMLKKYEDELLTTYQIAEECECSRVLVGSQLKKFGIEIREIKGKNHPMYGKHLSEETKQKMSESLKGENHPNWQGGKSFEPYCPKFDKERREYIRDKFNRTCVLCGKTEKENGRKLSVHHVDYNKDQGCNGNSWFLVPLCASCHGKTNKNREEYQEFFEEFIDNFNITNLFKFLNKSFSSIKVKRL